MNKNREDWDVHYKFASVDELIDAATEIEKITEEPFKRSVFLYFIARYFTTVYEAKIGELPVQIWNEYRNALDHFMREPKLTKSISSQVHKMEGHIQRAALDGCKFLYYSLKSNIENEIKYYNNEAFAMLDGGGYKSSIANAMNLAEGQFIQAKIIDSGLGDNHNVNNDVIKSYLSGCFTLMDIENKIRISRPLYDKTFIQLEEAKRKARDEGEKSWGSHLKGHLLGHLVWYIIYILSTLFFGYLAFKIFPDLNSYLVEYIPQDIIELIKESE